MARNVTSFPANDAMLQDDAMLLAGQLHESDHKHYFP
jgi:hypothetical protein